MKSIVAVLFCVVCLLEFSVSEAAVPRHVPLKSDNSPRTKVMRLKVKPVLFGGTSGMRVRGDFRQTHASKLAQLEKITRYDACMSVYQSEGVHAAMVHAFTLLAGTSLSAVDSLALPGKHGLETCLVGIFGLPRFITHSDVAAALRENVLVRLDDVSGVRAKRSATPYGYPWVRDYLVRLVADLRQDLSNPRAGFLLGSGVRSQDEHQDLVRRRISPADCNFDQLCSTHTRGVAFDISMNGMQRNVKAWLLQRLKKERDIQNSIMVTLEEKSNCFHVVVLPPENIVLSRH